MLNIEHEHIQTPENQSGFSAGPGGPGLNLERTEGRAYYNFEERIATLETLVSEYEQFHRLALENGRRRSVFRARVSQEAFQAININSLPLEVALPLSHINPEETDVIIMLGENVHNSEVPEWDSVYNYWRHPNGNGRTPLNRVENINRADYHLTNQLQVEDAARLAEIWTPFGWTETSAREFIEKYQQHPEGIWFAGVIDRNTNQLISACMGEGLQLGEVFLIEATEFGTLPGLEGNGFCTAAVTTLCAQILRDTFYTNGTMPLLVSELSMTSRSDIVARHAGWSIPGVEANQDLDQPIQVLRYNVSVKDRRDRNQLRWQDLGEDRLRYQEAFSTPYRFWRNFIVGMLPLSAVNAHYSPEQIETMLSQLQERA